MTQQNINLNTASKEELKQIKGVNEERANKLVESRPFKSWDDVDRVPGFSQGMIEDLKQSGATIDGGGDGGQGSSGQDGGGRQPEHAGGGSGRDGGR